LIKKYGLVIWISELLTSNGRSYFYFMAQLGLLYINY